MKKKIKIDMTDAEFGRFLEELEGIYKVSANEAVDGGHSVFVDNSPQGQVDEDIEVHDSLNPALFDGDELKPEVKEAIVRIADEFTSMLGDDGIKFDLKDVVLVGSNVSYNYTKDSDLDIHLIADSKTLECPGDVYPLLYSAYRTLFNGKYDITIKGIPAEVYVEMDDLGAAKSNGVYSVSSGWIKHPERKEIPEIDMEAFDREFSKWERRYRELISSVGESDVGELDNKTSSDVVDFIEDLYDLRKESIAKDGEYGIGNLVFKEFRNRGWLDGLKEMRDELKSRELSLEGLNEAVGTLSDPKLLKYVRECVRFLADHGYDAKMSDLALYWDERTTRFGALGWPEDDGGPFRLYLSRHLVGEPEEVVKNTIYHELCHYLAFKEAFEDGAVYWSGSGRLKANAGMDYRKYMHHNAVWKKLASDVGAITGQNINVTDNFTTHANVGKAYNSKVKYVARCRHCGHEFTATRLTPFMKSVIQGDGHTSWYCKCPDGYKGHDFDMLMIDGKKTEAGDGNENG